jgi:hypothetical protein
MADRTEYSGETRRNTILKKPKGSIPIPWEQLRLAHLTGDSLDVTSEPNKRVWLGQAPEA